MTSSPFFWNRIANNYAKQAVADEASYQYKLAETQRYLHAQTRLLEFGCGTGSTAIYHAPKVAHITAMDYSIKMLDIAKKKASDAKLSNISFLQQQLTELDSPNGSWDVILGMSILHLVNNLDEHLSKTYALLKPGGVFISSTPCIADMNTWFKAIAPVFRILPFLPSVQVFSQQQLESRIKAVGFEVEQSWRPDIDKAVFIIARKP